MTYCDECPLRLYNSKHHNLQGIGDKLSGRVLVIPNVDYEAYKCGDVSFSKQVEIISSILSTGELENTLHIAPLIRCNESIGCDITDDIIIRCKTYLYTDINEYDWKDIMLCGSSAIRYLGIDSITPYLDTVIVDRATKRKYFVNYSPFVKYTDDNNFEAFKSRLIKWYNCSINKMYKDYTLIMI